VPPGARRLEVVHEFDAWGALAELLDAISRVLERNSIEHLAIPDRQLSHPLIVVRSDDRERTFRALAGDPEAATWWAAPAHDGLIGAPVPIRSRLRRRAGSLGVLVSRDLRAPGGQALTNSEMGVLVEFWRELDAPGPAAGGGVYPAGTLLAPRPNGILDYATQRLWRNAQGNRHRLPDAPPHLLTVQEPVDLVYTWVDGADPAWLARKAAALGLPAGGASVDADIPARFHNHDELRYSLRSVQAYANWVRHIWIVTDQQTPEWLVPDDRLTVVDHREIFADPTVLPVFNSHAIESQLHHIPGLADLYLYLNDDMFFGRPVRPEDFFHGNGIPKFFTSPALIDLEGPNPDDVGVTAAAKNNRALIEADFGRTISNKLRHTPYPQSRPLLADFEAAHPEVFDSVMRSRLRQRSDYSIASSLSEYYAYALGRAVAGRVLHSYIDASAEDAEFVLERWLGKRDLECFCINQSGEGDATAAHRALILGRFLEAYFPVASRWEQAGGATS
jgi:hypothetical protein